MIDYRELLIKYIAHVRYQESVCFLSESELLFTDIAFSDEEKTALIACAKMTGDQL